jgi:titin
MADSSKKTKEKKEKIRFAHKLIKQTREQKGYGNFNKPEDSEFLLDAKLGEIATTPEEYNQIVNSIPNKVPDPPTEVTASLLDGQVSVTYNPPLYTGTSPILYYTLFSHPGESQQQTTSSSVVVLNLIIGQSYTFTMTATNDSGTSVSSLESNSILPGSVPDAPRDVEGQPENGKATVLFQAPLFDGGSAILDYTVTAYVNSQSIGEIVGDKSSISFPGLQNGTTYQFSVKARNNVGFSAESVLSAPITPVTVPEAPTDVMATAGNSEATISFMFAGDGGSAILDYTVTAYVNSQSIGEIVVNNSGISFPGLQNGTTYQFSVKARNNVGFSTDSDLSEPITPGTVPEAPTGLVATVGNSEASIKFLAGGNGGSAITNYQYSISYVIDGKPVSTEFIAFSPKQPVSPVIITGFINGITYTVILKSVNSFGTSAPSAAVTFTPVTVPEAPTGVVATAGDSKASITFTTNGTGGSAVLDYTVSAYINGQFISKITTYSSGINFTGLKNGTTYQFSVKARNRNGYSADSALSDPVTPGTVPQAPTGVVATPGNSTASIAFTAGGSGGLAIIDYTVTAYINNAPIGTIVGYESGIVFPGLQNGTTYTFSVKAHNRIGYSDESAQSDPVTPVTVPDAPTGVVATAGNSKATITFTTNGTGGSNIMDYTVSAYVNGQLIKQRIVYNSGADFPELQNATIYQFSVKARNRVGYSAESTLSNPVTPASVPEAPRALVATPGNSSASIRFTAGADGGSAIINYAYATTYTSGTGPVSSDFIAFEPPQTGPTVTISGLVNGRTYTVALKAVNLIGSSVKSADVTVTPIAPPTVPEAPRDLAATPGNSTASIAFTAGADGGSAITNYAYSTSYEGGTGANQSGFIAFQPVQKDSPVVISGLMNGRIYTINLKAINSIGSSVESAAVTVTPVTVPEAPSAVAATAGNSKATISFTTNGTGGSTIMDYTVSAYVNGQFIQQRVVYNSGADFPGLQNGTTYQFSVKARNRLGYSTDSTPLSIPVTPATVPERPTELIATPGNSIASIAFTAGSDGGSAITNYAYSTTYTANAGAISSGFIEFTPPQTGPDVTISGLVNGRTYTVALKAVNVVGPSVQSGNVSVTPKTVPVKPTGLIATPGESMVTISFVPGDDGGSAITKYAYAIRNLMAGGPAPNFVEIDPASATSVIIPDLQRGTPYSVMLKAINSVGPSVESSEPVEFTTLTVPGAPSNLVATPGESMVTISFTPGADGGSAITKYAYAIRNLMANGAAPDFVEMDPASATSVIIYNLILGTPYSVMLKAINSVGPSVESSEPVEFTTLMGPMPPEAPSNLVATPDIYSASISFTPGADGGSNITNYAYSMTYTGDAGPVSSGFIDFDPPQTGTAVNISNLQRGTTYTVILKAINSVSPSVESESVEFTTKTRPGAPIITSATPGNKTVSITFQPNGDGGSQILNYQYTLRYESSAEAPVTIPFGQSTIILDNLTNETTYTLELKAFNLAGASDESTVSFIPKGTGGTLP